MKGTNPSSSKQSISNHFPVKSTLAILLFNETNNKVKIKPTFFYQREISCFFICPTVDFHSCGYAMYFQDVETPRSQFKRRDKFGLTRIFPINTECKNCHQLESKIYTTFFPHAFRPKADSMCHMYPVEDCMNLGGTRVIYSNYHTRNMTPRALFI